MPDTVPEIVWFKRDLRVADHWPLLEAARRGPVVGLYVYEPEILEAPEFEASHLVFINESLREVREALRQRGGELLIRRGEMVSVLAELRSIFAFVRLWSHEETGNMVTFRRDQRVARWCRATGIEWQEFRQDGVIRRLRSRDGWATAWEQTMSLPCAIVPDRFGCRFAPGGTVEPGDFLSPEEAGLGASSKPEAQRGGETAAGATLQSFLSGRGLNYRKEMSSPLTGWTACSRLSPYLAWGCLSLRTVAQATRQRRENLEEERAHGLSVDRRWFGSLTSFEARLRWHCHFMQKLETEPGIEFQNFSSVYDGLREEFTESAEGRRRLEAWMEGRTGYPMIDACMRSVRATGWLNFRMRAMLVSFASYHLWLHWRPTAVWLARHFLDFEPGIHFSQFQMQSGTTGINTVRIYSPAKQLLDQDPQGVFVRRWVPELEAVPTVFLAQPEKMPSEAQRRSGCRLGFEYPVPIVDHALACREAKAKIGEVRRREEARAEARRVYVTHGSRKRGAGGARSIRSEWRERGLSAAKRKAAPSESSCQLELDLFDSRLRDGSFPGEMTA